MTRNTGSFQCPICKKACRTQVEADRCGLRTVGEPKHKIDASVAYTFFDVKMPWRDQPAERNHWQVLNPSVSIEPSAIDDNAHEHRVRVRQINTEAVRDFPESELR